MDPPPASPNRRPTPPSSALPACMCVCESASRSAQLCHVSPNRRSQPSHQHHGTVHARPPRPPLAHRHSKLPPMLLRLRDAAPKAATGSRVGQSGACGALSCRQEPLTDLARTDRTGDEKHTHRGAATWTPHIIHAELANGATPPSLSQGRDVAPRPPPSRNSASESSQSMPCCSAMREKTRTRSWNFSGGSAFTHGADDSDTSEPGTAGEGRGSIAR